MLFIVAGLAYLLHRVQGATWDIAFNNMFGFNFPTRLPGVVANEPEEKSFAGQLHTQIRLPFGPNPQQKTLNSIELFANKKYHAEYQKNIFNVQPTSNVDWRLDENFLSPLNNYTEYHMSEPNQAKKISNFYDKQKSIKRGPKPNPKHKGKLNE